MPDPNILVARYTRDLLSFDEQNIMFGRDNFEPPNYNTDYIVIDNLLVPKVRSQYDYFPATEEMRYMSVFNGPFTLDFFGPNAFSNTTKFVDLNQGHRAFDLSIVHGVTVYTPENINNLRFLTGTDQQNRYQVQVNVRFITTTIETILRIDTANTETFFNK